MRKIFWKEDEKHWPEIVMLAEFGNNSSYTI